MGTERKDVDRFDVDVFVMGHDWEGSLTSLKISVKSFILTAQKRISTTKIKQELYGKDTK